MKFAEAFRRLGYILVAPRTDWSCVKEDGVALSLWRSEIDWKSAPIAMNTRVHAGPRETWNAAGANKRVRDLTVAVDRFGGWIDVVIVDGIPGNGIKSASPWIPLDREGLKWRVREFDKEPGHFAAEAVLI